MSWIQENRFAAGLGGLTAAAAVILVFWGIKAGGAYNAAKEEYAAAADETDSMAKGKLYPEEDNLQAKKKAVAEYERSVKDLQEAFGKFRSPALPDVDPAAFSETLLKAKDAATKAFADVRPVPVGVPEGFFLGFEAYTASPVKREATGILTYELEAISELAANLAAAAPAKLLNIHRAPLPEEQGQEFDSKGKSYRALPVELSFNGTEASFRKFLSSLDDSEKHYYVVRSIRVNNEKTKAPTAADGQFSSGEESAESTGGSSAFSGAFVLPGDEPPAAEETSDEGAAGLGSSSDELILQQVLGSEKINVFLRIDILQFLEAQ